uniref:Galectin n=1 Tax=Syphacia muris TaxID=451379 RepID=A0A0N5A9F3_9BILA
MVLSPHSVIIDSLAEDGRGNSYPETILSTQRICRNFHRHISVSFLLQTVAIFNAHSKTSDCATLLLKPGFDVERYSEVDLPVFSERIKQGGILHVVGSHNTVNDSLHSAEPDFDGYNIPFFLSNRPKDEVIFHGSFKKMLPILSFLNDISSLLITGDSNLKYFNYGGRGYDNSKPVSVMMDPGQTMTFFLLSLNPNFYSIPFNPGEEFGLRLLCVYDGKNEAIKINGVHLGKFDFPPPQRPVIINSTEFEYYGFEV